MNQSFRKKAVVISAFQWFPSMGEVGGVNLPGWIETNTGTATVSAGDWIITGVEGERYPCPDSVFRATYEAASNNMTFGAAIEAMREGRKVCRAGWNGKGLWACLVPSKDWGIGSGVPFDWGQVGNDLRSWMGLKDVNNNFGPWVPSTSDVLADDWMVVEE